MRHGDGSGDQNLCSYRRGGKVAVLAGDVAIDRRSPAVGRMKMAARLRLLAAKPVRETAMTHGIPTGLQSLTDRLR